MKFFSFCYNTVAASRCRIFLALFQAFSVEVVASTPRGAGGMLAVCTDVAELLVIVAMCEPNLVTYRVQFSLIYSKDRLI
jgi:hypothetical protein